MLWREKARKDGTKAKFFAPNGLRVTKNNYLYTLKSVIC